MTCRFENVARSRAQFRERFVILFARPTKPSRKAVSRYYCRDTVIK